MKHISKFLPVLIILFLASCDIAEVNHNNLYFVSDTIEGGGGNDSSEVALRKTLIIDFSAHKCNNCPGAHRIVEQLNNIHGDKILPVVIHGGILAMPDQEHPTDFRTADGNTILIAFGVGTFPTGRVNFYDEAVTLPASWTTEVENFTNDTATVKIEIENEYTESSRELSCNVTCTALSDLEPNLKLTVFLLESHIISGQDDLEVEPGGYVEDYEHNHVFRAAISEVWGEALFSQSQEAGSEDSKSFSLTLDPEWNETNCMVIAFIYDDDTKEIINAEEIHFE